MSPGPGGRPRPSRSRFAAGLSAVAVATVLLPTAGWGQVRASERATVTQVIDGTTITLDFARPSRHGRDSLFGGVVHWGERWTPGANMATTLSTDRAMVVEGTEVPAGSYSVWLDVEADAPWTLVLDPEPEIFHTSPPDDREGQLRFTVTPRETEFEMETLLWYFSRVRADGGELRMHWGRDAVVLDVEVTPSTKVTLTPEEAEPYVGRFRMRFLASDDDPGGTEITQTLRYDPEIRMIRVAGLGGPVRGAESVLVPAGAEGVFHPAFIRDGELWDVEVAIFFEFEIVDGAPSPGFSVRDFDDSLLAEARRWER